MWIKGKTYCSEDDRVFDCLREDTLIDKNKSFSWKSGGHYAVEGKVSVYLTIKNGAIHEGEHESKNGAGSWVVPLHPITITLRECEAKTVVIDLTKGEPCI